MTALCVTNLRVETITGRPIVEDVSLSVAAGEILAIVGESGSGKTTTGLAMLGHARPGLVIRSGTYQIGGSAGVTTSDLAEVAKQRGRFLSYVPQDPATALNPSMRIGDQIAVMLKTHGAGQIGEARIRQVLEQVQLPTDRTFRARYPHQLSGGQQQRVTIAMGLVCAPILAVFDEPTTGLDVVTQARLLEQVERIRNTGGMGLIYVTHDLGVVAQIADRVAVMYAGRIVEEGPARALLRRPRHPYTAGLLAATPDHARSLVLRSIPGTASAAGDLRGGCSFTARCDLRVAACESREPQLDAVDESLVRCFEWSRTELPSAVAALDTPDGAAARPLLELAGVEARYRAKPQDNVVARDISFTVGAGECVALVGQSGSGKSTLSRLIVGLHGASEGRVTFDGQPLAARAQDRSREQRRSVQMIFQNPRESLNPRQTILEAITRSAVVLRGLDARAAEKVADDLLARVHLDRRVAGRFPEELSGGQLQRVAIARALAAQPRLLVCDEVTSALDVSVQAAVLELLNELRTDLDLGLLFVTHDLGVVASIAQRVLVLDRGAIVEQGTVHDVLQTPRHDYTKMLIAAAPSISTIQAAHMEVAGA